MLGSHRYCLLGPIYFDVDFQTHPLSTKSEGVEDLNIRRQAPYSMPLLLSPRKQLESLVNDLSQLPSLA